ncbi:OmpA family protein [Hoeflea sp. CAU 1731]
MNKFFARGLIGVLLSLLWTVTVSAQDIDGVIEHPMVERYPGQDIRWQVIENYLPFRIPVGPVTGYRQIEDWIDTEGRVTRTFYSYEGTDRSYAEIYKNYLDAFETEDFEILTEGNSVDRKGVEAGSTKWFDVYSRTNPFGKPGDVNTLKAGTSSSGGAGGFVARKERAAGIVYVVVNVEQHSENYVGTLIDIIEVAAAETGLVAIDAEAIGKDLTKKGRVVLDGILFDFDKATLKPESKSALDAVAAYIKANPDGKFYIVGHTDSTGAFEYNRDLSADRAASVVKALGESYGIRSGRLEAHGIGPLVPIFSNASEAGREKNRRVEMVERQ